MSIANDPTRSEETKSPASPVFLDPIEPPRSPISADWVAGHYLPSVQLDRPRGCARRIQSVREFKYEAAIRGDRFDVLEWWDLGASLRRHDVVEVGSAVSGWTVWAMCAASMR